ncbi:hypothetical protein [Pseudomonas aeruginosa]|uniref:hypothetical protein n=1 Tax=Pseudomonas aeruginosa TaxID=287 RepID=UPI00177B8125|nr:hypothetical protein [Pseudomonas aeruginosa]EKW5286264.1 hypothetical protein [Pseudomonas aeruginosa]EKW5493608.1 hypothetical protein [Pseudomonas aeruginosa]MBO8341144.1 hypothetical protein [Pseudomonas aeruginosa]HEP8865370.1 hypothetical protein [Pseudomonas aeruginosa]
MKPCTLGKRHSWTFVRNVVTSHLSGRFGRITKRGFYRCECGAEKYGNAGDLPGGSPHA